ncbi:MAG: DUF3667 domain-containing protein [Paucibacter sp.]|nr:DUF3667 domain-containing protein [Roseateles sp.]
MTTTPHPDGHACPNCGAATSGNYCQHCGQETHLHRATALEFLHEFIGHHVAAEGKLWGTLGRLLFRPGALTNEYIRGRRVSFVQPLRLYLTMSVIFFALLKSLNGFDLPLDSRPDPVAQAKVEQAAKEGRLVRTDKVNIGDRDLEEILPPSLSKHWLAFEHMTTEEKARVFAEGFYHYAPTAMFCMLPLFALYLKLLYLGSGRWYGEHLLFALHSNAFAFVMFTAMLLIENGLVHFVMWLWLLGYLPWAMRRVYQRGRFGTFWRWAVLMFVYALTMGAGFLFSLAAGIMSAGH